MEDWTEYITALKEEDLYRCPVSYRPLDAVHVESQGEKYLLLATNNYLGLTHSLPVKQAGFSGVLFCF